MAVTLAVLVVEVAAAAALAVESSTQDSQSMRPSHICSPRSASGPRTNLHMEQTAVAEATVVAMMAGDADMADEMVAGMEEG